MNLRHEPVFPPIQTKAKKMQDLHRICNSEQEELSKILNSVGEMAGIQLEKLAKELHINIVIRINKMNNACITELMINPNCEDIIVPTIHYNNDLFVMIAENGMDPILDKIRSICGSYMMKIIQDPMVVIAMFDIANQFGFYDTEERDKKRREEEIRRRESEDLPF